MTDPLASNQREGADAQRLEGPTDNQRFAAGSQAAHKGRLRLGIRSRSQNHWGPPQPLQRFWRTFRDGIDVVSRSKVVSQRPLNASSAQGHGVEPHATSVLDRQMPQTANALDRRGVAGLGRPHFEAR